VAFAWNWLDAVILCVGLAVWYWTALVVVAAGSYWFSSLYFQRDSLLFCFSCFDLPVVAELVGLRELELEVQEVWSQILYVV
jgi:hypothetical protein